MVRAIGFGDSPRICAFILIITVFGALNVDGFADLGACGDRNIVGTIGNRTAGADIAGGLMADCGGTREGGNAGEVVYCQPAKDD